MEFVVVPIEELMSKIRGLLDERDEHWKTVLKYGELPDILPVSRAARILGINYRTVIKMAKRKDLEECHNGNGAISITKDSFLTYLGKNPKLKKMNHGSHE
jgi:hypothetical protein